jgi:polyketide biosynthesis enoyl-CoA hydratase PksH
VIATPDSHFALSEAMWGLLPACVLPFLVRRTGFQEAYRLTLTTDRIGAHAAHSCHLVDLLAPNLEDATRKVLLRLQRIDPQTVLDLKRYFKRMWFLDEVMTRAAVEESARLALEPRIRRNIARFVAERVYPWEPGVEGG